MNITKMEAEYNDTIEDISSIDENLDNTVKDYFSGTGTLLQNELYMQGRTANHTGNLGVAFSILKEEIHKRAVLIKPLKRIFPDMELETYSYEELLYLTAGLYNNKKSKES